MPDNLPQLNPEPQLEKNPIFKDPDYQPILSNWFTSKPYGFRFTPRDVSADQAKVMFLPINPSNLVVTTHFATSITPTLYGTVEEHSPVRYHDITIEGTTGIGPKYTDPIDAQSLPKPKSGRSTFSVQQSIGGGFFSKTLTTASKIYSDASSLTKSDAPITGLQLDQTGYVAFHNLYRFLLAYKKDASGQANRSARESEVPPLVFFNYKDNNEYSVVVKTFTLRRDKDNPMLYYYNISMRGYDLTKLSNSNKHEPKATKLLADLGLDGVKGSTFLSEAKNISSQAKGILGSVASGINQLGR